MEEQKKEFTGVWIPKHIIEDFDLSPIEKLIWAEINCFDVCYFKNNQLAKRYKRSDKTISLIINKLKRKDYIEEVEFNGRMRGIVAINDLQTSMQGRRKCKGRVEENVKADPPKTSTKDNYKDNNVDNIPKGIKKQVSYGREDINNLTEYFRNKLNSSFLDGTIKENRKYAKLLIDRFKKDYPDYNTEEQIIFLIDRALEDNFHSKNTTNFKYLYYNAQKIIQSIKSNTNRIVKI